MKNGIEDLRNHMFTLLEELNDPDIHKDKDKLERVLLRADAGAKVAQTIINSAKVEVAYLSVTGQTKGTKFLDAEKPKLAPVGRIPAGS